jgi:hypothetical protein
MNELTHREIQAALKQPDVVKYSKKVALRPFEDDSSLQFYSRKSGKCERKAVETTS